ncbi:aconitate hydratase AcnA [Glutamicibacter uratoxydans]|uniref:aconitate hydratase AcnA n=1 Tax=Glutamicibacter uratoxydans TaxID=43667 RepID=UPI003D6E948C
MTTDAHIDPALISTLKLSDGNVRYVDLRKLPSAQQLPLSLKILLENVLRHGGPSSAVQALLDSGNGTPTGAEVSFYPGRVVMQDMAGAPVIHDLVTLREAVLRHGGDPSRINPGIPAELVIDHSVIVDEYGSDRAFARNTELEFERNEERFRFLRWAQSAFDGFRVVPPGRGIIHQVNIEHLTRGILQAPGTEDEPSLVYPDTCIGTDSHTTMVNGLGILGWGVGGIEATSALLGQPLSLLVPPVVGVELSGTLPSGSTATDLVLTITELLRTHQVVGKIVEFHGPGLAGLPVADRATIANMSPEFGSTAALFPVDQQTVDYYRLTGRDEAQIELIEAYARAQGLWADGSASRATYTETLELDLSTVVPSLAGPYRPQDRIALDAAQQQFRADLDNLVDTTHPARTNGELQVPVRLAEHAEVLRDGTLAIAAITSCTNTSNPQIMMTAALLARNAVERGLRVPPWVKTSLAPGSQVVTAYLEKAGLLPALETLGFHVVGYGCTTCMGNSGSLPEPVAQAAREEDLVLTSILSGNRNFEGRISPDVKMNYLASPPLVIAHALAGTMDIDVYRDSLGTATDGTEVMLRDLWPSAAEVEAQLAEVVNREMYKQSYSQTFTGTAQWEALVVPQASTYEFGESTYMLASPFLEQAAPTPAGIDDLHAARVLVKLGDSVTTDHISPVGSIRADSPAGEYLLEQGVDRKDFNTYGSRRGNHEVMVRGTFANVRLRNELAEGQVGAVTQLLPSREPMSIYEASRRYRARGTGLLVLAGREYGSGSARDYAAKGTYLLGVRVVLAQSFERIHRSNLVGMGIFPLQFKDGDSAHSLGLNGTEEYDVSGLKEFGAGGHPDFARVSATREDGTRVDFEAHIRIDTPAEAQYIRHGGMLPFALRATLRD